MSDTNKKVVFYGAGSYAVKNISLWKKEWNVICFVDQDEAKWGTTIGGISVRSLEEVMDGYPNIDFVITTTTRLNDIYNFLREKGIGEERISFVVPREKRLGCSFLGKWFQLDGGKVIKTCCFEQGYKQIIHDSFDKEYEHFIQNVGVINKKLRRHEPTSCDGCCMLIEDWWEIEPKVQGFSLATGFKGDVCNCRCIYCDAEQLLGSSNDIGNLSALKVCEYFASRADFDAIGIAINNGEFVVNRDRKDILELCRKKKWHMTLFTNGIRISDDILEYMKENKTTVICSLDAGTKETFKKIKCVDGFEKAVNNLKVYSKLGRVVLKYIVIKGCNDNMTDVNSFINIARDVAHTVVISRDLYMRNDGFSDNEREIYRLLFDELYIKSSIPVVASEDCIPSQEVEWFRKLLGKKA